ncbi:hypothetical protein C8R44DRAFT_793968 [Mycena epipterygia]|nr:hypothetical protein C8R44DRAFT_793968 [Mycena epipterygia]
MPSLNTNLGAIELGTIFSILLFGIVTLQTFNYYRNYAKDGRPLKTLVFVTWLFELAHSICIIHTVYSLTVTFYGQPEHIEAPPNSLGISLLFSALITELVQMFFANRIRVLSGGHLIIPIICVMMASTHLVSSCAITAISIHLGSLSVIQVRFRWILMIAVIASTISDVLIASSLCYWLWHFRKNGLKQTRRTTDSLIAWCIETTLITSGAGIIELILFLAVDSLVYQFFYLLQAKLFSNTMLASLNARYPSTPPPESVTTAFVDLDSAVQARSSGRNRV